MARIEGWERGPNTCRLPIYGVQKVYLRETDETAPPEAAESL